METIWEASLLGRLEVRRDGRTIDRFTTQKVGLLLAFLALHPRRSHPREILADRLWPDSSADTGRLSLRVALHSLRRLLEPDGVSPGSVLVATRTQVRLCDGAVRTDVDEFTECLQRAAHARDPMARRHLLRQAVRHYHGELLPDFYEDWVLGLRDQLQAQYETAKQQLEALERQLGDDAVLPPSSTAAAATAKSVRLPRFLTRFFGRQPEIDDLRRLLALPDLRLITLTGAGGSGKTRLAAEAAHGLQGIFPGGVTFVGLADLTDPERIVDTIAHAFRPPSAGAPMDGGNGLAAQSAGLTGRDIIRQAVNGRRTLLILDNVEQLLPGAAAIVQHLLLDIESLTCLVTSRQILQVSGERELAVAPLATPSEEEAIESLASRPCVQLYLDRTQAVRSDFQITAGNRRAVARLCARLEGMPLAIELAAAWARTLTPAEMVKRLSDHLDALGSADRDWDGSGAGDVPMRQRTLRATIEWSAGMLPSELRQFLLRLAVFRGGWTATAAEAVCGQAHPLESLSRLRERSLIVAEERGGRGAGSTMRFRLLEMLREYAWAELSPTDRGDLEEAHARYYLALAEEQAPRLNGREQPEAVELLDAERNNLRSALAWFRSHGEYDAEVRLVGALWYFWCLAGHFEEGSHCLTSALERGASGAPDKARARALHGAGTLAAHRGDYDLARRFHEACLEVLHALGDERGEAVARASLGIVAANRNDHEAAEVHFRTALAVFQTAGEIRSLVATYTNLAVLALCRSDLDGAETLLQEALQLRDRVTDQRVVGFALTGLGAVARDRGDLTTARSHHAEALELFREAEDRQGIAAVLQDFAALAVAERAWTRAVQLIGFADRLREEIDVPLAFFERQQYAQVRDQTRTALSEPDVERANGEGRVLTLEQAIALALEGAARASTDR